MSKLILDIELLIDILMENDSLKERSQLSRNHIQELIKVRDQVKEIRVQELVDQEVQKRVKQIRFELLCIKHLPQHYLSIIQEMTFKAQRYLETAN